MNENGLHVRKIPDGPAMFIPGDVSIVTKTDIGEEEDWSSHAETPYWPQWEVSAPPSWKLPDDPLSLDSWINPEPVEPKSPIPKPSTTPPMWAVDVNKSRRPRKNRGQPNSQGIA